MIEIVYRNGGESKVLFWLSVLQADHAGSVADHVAIETACRVLRFAARPVYNKIMSLNKRCDGRRLPNDPDAMKHLRINSVFGVVDDKIQ